METEIPDSFLCPITADEIIEPVMDIHGHNFEK